MTRRGAPALRDMLDLHAPEHVQIEIRNDGAVLWVNVDGLCALRVCRIGAVEILDHRRRP